MRVFSIARKGELPSNATVGERLDDDAPIEIADTRILRIANNTSVVIPLDKQISSRPGGMLHFSHVQGGVFL